MKKIIILFIFFWEVNISGFYSDNGGYARISALGIPEIAISDLSLNFDLFSNGFLAAAYWKEIKNKFSFNTGFYPESINENNIKIRNTNFFFNDNIKNHNVFLKINDKNIIMVNLKAKAITSEYEESDEETLLLNSIKSSETKIIAGIGYAIKIAANIAAGIYLNDNYVFLENEKNLEKGVEENEAKIYESSAGYYSKLEYIFSLAYSVNNNLSFALLFGDKKSEIPFIINEISGLTLFNPARKEFDYENLFFNRYNILLTSDILKSVIVSDEKIFTKEKKEPVGYNIDFGVELDYENIQAVITAGILINYNYKYDRDSTGEIDYHYFPPKITDSSYTDLQYIANSSSHKIDLSFRYFINDFLTFSNKFNYIFAGFDYNEQEKLYNVKLMQYNIVPGFSLKILKILFPLEFILKNFNAEKIDKENLTQINTGLFLYGIKIGLEYEIEKELYLRAGYSIKKGGSEYLERNGQNLIDEKPGTDYNPFLIKSTFGFGIGSKFEDIELNLSFLNEEIFKMPSANNYNNRANKVIIDFNKFF